MTEGGEVTSHSFTKGGSSALIIPCEGAGCRYCAHTPVPDRDNPRDNYECRADGEPWPCEVMRDDWWPRVQAAYKAITEQAACWETEFADGNVGIVLGAMDAAVVAVRLLDEGLVPPEQCHSPGCASEQRGDPGCDCGLTTQPVIPAKNEATR